MRGQRGLGEICVCLVKSQIVLTVQLGTYFLIGNEVGEINIQKKKERKNCKVISLLFWGKDGETHTQRERDPLPTIIFKNFLVFRSKTQRTNAYLFIVFHYLLKSLYFCFTFEKLHSNGRRAVFLFLYFFPLQLKYQTSWCYFSLWELKGSCKVSLQC